MIDPKGLRSVTAQDLKVGDVILILGHEVHQWKRVTHVRATPNGIEVATEAIPLYAPDHVFVVDGQANEQPRSVPTPSNDSEPLPRDGDPRPAG